MDRSGTSGAPLVRRRRGRWSRAVWAEEIKAFRESGLSPEAYAAKRGVQVVTLKKWARILSARVGVSKGDEVPTFVPVSIVDPKGQPGGKPFLVEVDLVDGRRARARVGSDADMRRFADLVDALDGGGRC